MGEAKRKKSTTQKFLAKYPDCYFCAGCNPATTREHMPPKALFDNSHRPADLVMPACDGCNRGTSTADLAASLMSRWQYEFDPQSFLDHQKLSAQVRRQAPELLNEWVSADAYDRQDLRRHLLSQGVNVPADAGLALIGPEPIRQLNLFAHKITIALYFEYFRVPLDHSGLVWAMWRSKEDFAKGVPTEALRIFGRYGTLTQGTWSTHQIFEYRYDHNRDEGLFGCMARFRNGLFVTGFVIPQKIKSLDERIQLDQSGRTF